MDILHMKSEWHLGRRAIELKWRGVWRNCQ